MWKIAGGSLARAARTLRRRHAESASGTFIVDRQGTVLGFDDAMEGLTGWPAVEVVGHHKDRPQGGARAVGPLYEGQLPIPDESETAELRLRCRDGGALLVELRLTRLAGRGERIAVRVLRVLCRESGDPADIGAGCTDPLTGLLDRDGFLATLDEQIEDAGAHGRTLALALVDVDHLRQVNDRMGHSAGDRVLREVAGIIRATVDDDVTVARIGDDDFAVLLPATGRGEARQIAARLRSAVERFRFFDKADAATAPAITLSLGAATYPADAEAAADLIKRAGEALDQARSFGRNRAWCYTRRPRVPLEVPVYFDTSEPLLVGFTRDLSPSGVFVQTSAPVDMGMRCALTFGLPTMVGRVHVVGRVVRTVPPSADEAVDLRIPGMGIEFERFGTTDRRAIEGYLHRYESLTRRPEVRQSV